MAERDLSGTFTYQVKLAQARTGCAFDCGIPLRRDRIANEDDADGLQGQHSLNQSEDK